MSISLRLTLGLAYFSGRGVEKDEKKAKHYWQLVAMKGHQSARHNLGIFEERAGNNDRALEHFLIAAGCGYDRSLKMIQQMYMHGNAPKDDYEKALQAYQAYLSEIKSDDRDKAAAYWEDYKYYE